MTRTVAQAAPTAIPTLEAVDSDHLTAFCTFLHQHLNSKISVERWSAAFEQPWAVDAPNHGFMLKEAGGRIVGVIGAIYADRVVRGLPIRLCNITSWCVLPEYRRYGMKLAIAVISQPDLHFTLLSPTEVVDKSLRNFGFTAMDNSATVLPAIPGWQPSVRFTEDATNIEQMLQADDAATFRAHARFGWLRHLVVGKPGAFCHVAYTLSKLKGLPCADVMFTSNSALFLQYHPTLSRALLRSRGIVAFRIESRFLKTFPWFGLRVPDYYRKSYRSTVLAESEVSNFYSEIACLEM